MAERRDNTEFVLQLLKTHSVSRWFVDFFYKAYMGLADGKFDETKVITEFNKTIQQTKFTTFMGTDIGLESINLEKLYSELKKLFAPSYPEKWIIRAKLVDRGIDPDKFDFFGWNITISPEEEAEWNNISKHE